MSEGASEEGNGLLPPPKPKPKPKPAVPVMLPPAPAPANKPAGFMPPPPKPKTQATTSNEKDAAFLPPPPPKSKSQVTAATPTAAESDVASSPSPAEAEAQSTSATPTEEGLLPPPPKTEAPATTSTTADAAVVQENAADAAAAPEGEARSTQPSPVPAPRRRRELPKPGSDYIPPFWSAIPEHKFMLEVLKNGQIVSTLDISTQTHYIFGRLKSLDFPMNHQSMSRRHAVLQFRDNASLYLYDLDSTHGTFINKRRIPPHTYAEVKIGDLLSFGASTRKYILEGPASLRPQERKRVPMLINAEATQVEAPTHFTWADDVDDEDGATWGVGSASERAIEDDEKKEEERKNRDFDKGSATSDRQKKLLERMELRDRKMTNITKEMENLRSKEQSQAGLTEGQQARLQQCEERITALMEQRGDLVETINDSMEDKERRNAGMAGAIKKKNGRTRYSDSDEEDDFYDRTQNAAKKAVVVKKEIAVVPIKKNADTVAVARAAVKVAEMELENATSRVFKLELQLRDFATAKSKGEDADSLDSFMASITDTVKKDKRRDIEHEIKDLSERKALLAPLIVERKAALVRAEYASAGTDEAVKQLIERHKKEHEAEKAKRQREATAVAAKAKKDSGEAVDSKDAGAAGVRAKAVGTGVEQDPKEKAVKEASKTTDVGGTMAYLQLGKKRAEERKRKEEEEENKALGMVEQERVENEKKRNKFIDGFSASVEGGSKEPEDDPLERIRSALEAQRHRGRKEGQEDAFTAAQKRKTAQLSRLEGNDGEDESGIHAGLHLRKKQKSDENAEAVPVPTSSLDFAPASATAAAGAKAATDAPGQEYYAPRRAQKAKNAKKVVRGPEKPAAMEKEEEAGRNDTWVAPADQAGDGKTHLNSKFGY